MTLTVETQDLSLIWVPLKQILRQRLVHRELMSTVNARGASKEARKVRRRKANKVGANEQVWATRAHP